jgi:hypothetical protein
MISLSLSHIRFPAMNDDTFEKRRLQQSRYLPHVLTGPKPPSRLDAKLAGNPPQDAPQHRYLVRIGNSGKRHVPSLQGSWESIRLIPTKTKSPWRSGGLDRIVPRGVL